MVGMAAIAWWPAFTLGVWGEIFYDDIMALWAVSVAAFVFVVLERRPIGGKVARALVLLLPTVWLVLSFVVRQQSEDDIAGAIVDVVAFTAVIVGIPFTLWVLIRIVWPDFHHGTSRRSRWIIMGVVTGIVITSYVLGLNQASFLNCEDFALSGNSEPEGCVPLETTPTPG